MADGRAFDAVLHCRMPAVGVPGHRRLRHREDAPGLSSALLFHVGLACCAWFVLAVQGAVAARAARAPAVPAPASTWELLVLPGSWDSMHPGWEATTVFPALQRAAHKPLLALAPHDVESYLWQTQRITLTAEATRRLLAVHPDVELERWWISHYPFVVRVDGRLAYGGFFDGPMSQMSMECPVIHAELVDGRAVLHLLPRQMSFAFDPRFEETVGSDSGLLAGFVAETAGIAAAIDPEEPDPVRDRFRTVLRDPRIHALFGGLGRLVESVPPPPPEDVLLAANRTVDAAIAARQGARLARLLADDYHLFHPLGDDLGMRGRIPLDKEQTLAFFGEGWRPRRYAVLAVEPRVTGDAGVVYTLFYERGERGGRDHAEAILSRRRFRRTGAGWLLVHELHRVCFDDASRWDGLVNDEHFTVMLVGPCWPPPAQETEWPVPPPAASER